MSFKTSKKFSSGFTLVEIMVASALFVIISGSMLTIFNYVLKINRRSEALRQASQGVRNFMEFLVKEIRNGQVDYYVVNGDTYLAPISATSPCVAPGGVGIPADGTETYEAQENKLGIINTDNVQECFYYGNKAGAYIDGSPGSPPTTFVGGYTLVVEKDGIVEPQILNPPNMRVDRLMFLVRPQKDPYTLAGGLAEVQPTVTIIARFTLKLLTGEEEVVYYQTSVSTTKYDVPSE